MRKLILIFNTFLIIFLIASCKHNCLNKPMEWDNKIGKLKIKYKGDMTWMPPFKELYRVTFFDKKHKACAFGTLEFLTFPRKKTDKLSKDLRHVKGSWHLEITKLGREMESLQSLEMYEKDYNERKLDGAFNMGIGSYIDLNPRMADANNVLYVDYLENNYIKGGWVFVGEPYFGTSVQGSIIGKLITSHK